jgi:hypothetical protein
MTPTSALQRDANLDTTQPGVAQPVAAAAARVVSVFAVYGLCSLVLLQTQLFRDRSFIACCDASIQSYAWLGKVAEAARTFTIPMWDFSTYAGISFVGELQQGPLYPPSWILGILGFSKMPLVDAFLVLHFVLAAGFMHLLLRSFGLALFPAIAGSLIFAFCGYVPQQADAQPNIFAGLVWLPLVLFFYRHAILASKVSIALTYAGLAGVASAMQILAGHLQPFIYTSYACLLFALVEGFDPLILKIRYWSSRPLILVSLGQLQALCFAAVPLALSLEYLRLVYRWFDDAGVTGISKFPHHVTFKGWAQSGVLVWSDFNTLFNPQLVFKNYDASMFFTFTGLFAALFTLIRPSRVSLFLWILTFLAVLIALGGGAGSSIARLTYNLPLLAQTRTPVRAMYLFSFAAAALAAVGIHEITRLFKGFAPKVEIGIAAVFLFGVAFEVLHVVGRLGMPANQPEYAPLYYEDNPALSALEQVSNAGPRVDRFIAEPTELVPPNAGDLKPVMGVLGHRGTMLISEFDYISRGGWGPGASDSLDRLGVRWVVSEKPIEGLISVGQGPGYFLYERPGSLSAFWTLDPATGTRERAPVEAVEWGANSVKVRLGSIAPGHKLVFAQPAYPGFVAYAGESRVAIGREEIFPAITLDGTVREVTFAYRPVLWPWIALFVVSALVLAAAALSWAYPSAMRPVAQRASRIADRVGIGRVLRPRDGIT